MTRPIYEPNPQRGQASLEFGQQQLYRRPHPTTDKMWGVPDLLLSGGATTIPTDTDFPVPFPDYATPWSAAGSAPVVISDADGELFFLDITDDFDPGNDRWEVTTRREGWWAANLITGWDQVSTAGTVDIASVVQSITWPSPTGFAFDPTNFKTHADWMITGTYGTLDLDSFGFADDTYLSTIMMPHYVPTNKVWHMQALQRTGVDRGLSGIFMKWWFIKADDLSAWTFDSV